MKSKQYLSLYIFMILVLVACGSAEEMEETAVSPTPEATIAPTNTPEPEKEKIVLQWWDYYGLPELSEELDEAIARYQAENPDIIIERTIIPFGELTPRILEANESGELPDIMLIDNPNHQALADVGALADLTDYIAEWDDADLYFTGAWDSTIYQRRNYGVPFESNALGLFYNQDMFEQAGLTPPTTWEELREHAKQLTTEDRYGFCFSTSDTEDGTFTFLPFLWQAGGDIPTLGDEASIKTLTFIHDLVADGSIPQGNVTSASVYDNFASGQCAMMINGPWQLPNLANDNLTFAWNVARLPADVNVASSLGGENFAIGAGTDVDEAWAFIDWFTDPDHLKDPLLAVGLPNRSDMADDTDWVSDPHIAIFVDQVAVARPRAYGPNYPEISKEIQTMYRSVIEGTLTPEEAALQAKERIAPLLP